MATKGRGGSGGRRPGKSQSRKSSGGKGGSAPRDKSGSAGRAGAKPPADYPWGARPYRPEMTQKAARKAIRDQIGQRIPLREYRASITPLTPDERELLLDQAQRMLEFLYVHLPLKRALYASDPIQKLRLLRLSHAELDERAFQSAMIDVFVGLRDLHTNYVLPSAYGQKFAFLPFRVEEFYEPGGAVPEQRREYVVSWVSPVSTDRNLKEGAVISHWNGSPVALAVARNADREAGSNAEARRARGVEALTLRWLGMSLPPDEDWVTLTYNDGAGGAERESRFEWEVVDASDVRDLLAGMDAGVANPTAGEAEALRRAPAGPAAAAASAAAGWGIDWKTVLLQRARRAIFDAPAAQVEQTMSAYRARAGGALAAAARAAVVQKTPPAGAAPQAPAIPQPPLPEAEVSFFPDVYPRFGPVDTPSGRFGYVRLQTFAPQSRDVEGAVAEFARILRKLPPDGLILDVRGNGGGVINFGERILQMLTPRPITPEPFHFVATSLTQEIAARNDFLAKWANPIKLGIATGSTFSQGFPLTDPEACNDVGQVYQGPVVLVTDAFCYSTTDIFAAGFQDHAVGMILGTHKATGAGGANVWDHAELLQALSFTNQNPFVPLPQGARMRVAARRSTRLGERSGVPVEDLGVAPDGLYFMTRDDVLLHNKDLIAHAASILKKMEKQSLDVAAVEPRPVARLEVRSRNVNRVDVLVDARPVLTQDVAAEGGTQTLTLPSPAPAGSTVTVNGYRSGTLVVSRRLIVT